jgi:hypothetical protein
MSKENDTRTRMTGIVINGFGSQGYQSLALGYHMYREVIGINICPTTRFARSLFVCTWEPIWMSMVPMLVIDPEGF